MKNNFAQTKLFTAQTALRSGAARSIKKIILAGLFAMLLIFSAQTVFKSQNRVIPQANAFCLTNCEDVDEVSFTNFEGGGLQAPSKEGYNPSLTQVSSAREFIVKVVNFALGFLGLIAMIIIIYGGIRYVTSAGESDGVEKGKKSVIYASIGLLVVLGSYAIVSTILQAPTGTDTGVGAQSSGQTVVFSVEQIKNIPKTISDAYTVYSKNNLDLLSIKRDTENMQSLFTPLAYLRDVDRWLQETDLAFRSIQSRLSAIAQRSPKTSLLQERAQQYAIYTNSWLEERRKDAKMQSKIPECVAANDGQKCYRGTAEYPCEDVCKMGDFSNKTFDALKKFTDYLANGEGAPNFITGGGSDFMDISYKAFQKDNEDIVNKTIERISKAVNELKSSVSNVSSGEVSAIFTEIEGMLDKLKDPSGKNEQELKTTAVDLIDKISELEQRLQKIQFVKVYLSADQTEGNVPLIVNFNTSGTTDPSNKPIEDKNITWDFGLPSGNKSTCESKGQSATCRFMEVGTYTVSVEVKSSDADKIASGKAYMTIKVLPPKARIRLTATIMRGGAKFPVKIMDYDNNGFLLVNKDRLNVTLTQAKNGIAFDASGTTSANVATGSSSIQETIQRIKWDFGDGSDSIEGEPAGSNLTPTHYYSKTGNYITTLEVTDKNGVKDRKIFTVAISDIAAFIDIAPVPVGKTQTSFMISGQNSSSDNGQITSYEWGIAPDINKLGTLTKPVFSTKFSKPNTYVVTLKVTDSQGNEANDAAEIKIESAPPVARFTYSTPKTTQPAVILLDGTKTYDPDGSNKDITYSWTIEADPNDYQFVSGDAKSAKSLVKFKNLGTYKITLRASDKNEPDKITEESKEISITNLLDIAWGSDNTASANLDDKGEATAKFTGISEHATSFDFDFGDGEIESGTPSQSGAIETTHTYKKAGVFNVKLTVSDENNNKNSVSRKIIIGGAKSPVAVIKILINGEEYLDVGDTIKVSRKDVITFDASGSINTDGTKNNLKYQWDFGDGRKSSKDVTTYTYKELSPENQPYQVVLKVISGSDATKSSVDKINIAVVSMKPSLKSIVLIPESTELKTPLKVDLTALEAVDPDGKIVGYKWRYFDVNDPEKYLGEHMTTFPSTTITVGTKGNEGDTNKYKFSVTLIDDENNEVAAEDVIGMDFLPSLEVENGPNKPPIAKISADRTNIKVGESITFTSASSDPDGKITSYIWDTDGTGFAGKEETQKTSVTIKYDKPSQEGIKVRLKVVDDNYGEAISDPITIYVISKYQPPKAAFTSEQTLGTKTVSFKNNSTADTAQGAKIVKYVWDFDTLLTDSDGDGKKDNDTDSILENPVHTYESYGTFYAKLTVTDDDGNQSSVINPVIIKAPQSAPVNGSGQQQGSGGSNNSGQQNGFGTQDMGLNLGNIIPNSGGQQPGGSGGSSTTSSTSVLNLKISTNPPTDKNDGKIHLAGSSGTVEFYFTESIGDIVKITGDKNIFFDTNKDGIKDNDIDFQTQSKMTPWKTNFESAWGPIAVKITAYDKAGNKDSVIKNIVFDSLTNAGSLNVFVVPGNMELYGALASMFGFGILSVRAFKRKSRKCPK